MANKSKPQRCSDCKYSQYVPTANKSDPEIIYCSALEKRLVARAARKCLSFDPDKN